MSVVTGETTSGFKLCMADMRIMFCSFFAEIFFHGVSITRCFYKFVLIKLIKH